MESILFIGKYDDDMLLLENQIVSMRKILDGKLKIKPNSFPDVVKHKIDEFNCIAWLFLGDVKPTVLLKSLIERVDLIIFTFNLENPETLNFLIKGWLPIIDKIDKNKITNQKRIFVGTQTDKIDTKILNRDFKILIDEIDQNTKKNIESFDQIDQNSECKNFDDLIQILKKKLNCETFIKETKKDKSSDLIKSIKGLIKDEKSQQKKDIISENLGDSTENNEMSITYYLQFKLYDVEKQILKIIINEKSKMNESLKKFSSQFIKSENVNVLYYTINKNKSDYTVNYYNNETLIHKIHSIISIQMNPSSKSNPEYRIFVVCNIEQIKNSFKLNENCFSFAIGINSKDNPETLKQKVINYLQIKDSINSNDPVIYIFKNNEFQELKEIKQTQDELKRKPLFISFEQDKFTQIHQNIQDHMIILSIPIKNKKKEEVMKNKNSNTFCSINNPQKQSKNIKKPIENSNVTEMVIDESFYENSFSLNDKTLNNIRILTIYQVDLDLLSKFSSLKTIIIKCEKEIQIKPQTLDTIGSLIQIELNSPSIIIEKSNFTKNKKLESIVFNSKTITIKENCFNHTVKLDILTINSQQIQIFSECFRDSSLQSIIFEGEILIIGNICFQNCENLEQISLKNINYVELGKESFIGCNKLNIFDITPKNSIDKYFKQIETFGKLKLTYKVVEKATNKLTYEVLKIARNRNESFYSKTIKTIRNKKDDLSNFFKNIIELTKLDNQFVLPIKGFSFLSFNKESFPMIFTKNIQGHTLEDYINKDNLPISKKYIILIFITIGMKYLHSKNIVHTNLKPSSIIIDENLYPHINEYFIPSINKTHYTAPEIFENNEYSTESDIYSFSIIAYILLTGHSPFRNCEIYELSKCIQNKKEELSFEHISDSNIKQFFEQCTSITPSNRLPFDKICKELIKPQYVELFKLNYLDINTALKSYGIQIEYKIKHVETLDRSESNINIDLHQQNSQLIIDSNANISSNDLENDTITIVRYLKTKLFDEQYNLNIEKIEIKSKSKCSLEFNDIKSEILSDDSQEALFYSINPNKNYKIELYNEHTKIQQLPAFLSVQYKPKKNGEYRILVVCNIEQIKNDFKLNENCFSIAIGINSEDNPGSLKQKVINYLQIKYKLSSNDAVIYVFKNNEFQIFKGIKQTPDELKRTPLFISFKRDKFQQIQQHIQNYMTIQQRTFSESVSIMYTRYLKIKLFTTKEQLLVVKIEDNSKIKKKLKDHLSKFIKSESSDFLYYTINQESNYKVEYFNYETSTHLLPSIMSIQMIPSSETNPYYNVFVVCNIEQIQNDFKLNENCFSIAIGINLKDKPEILKQKVINYLQIKYSISSNDPVIYVFKNNRFQNFEEIKQIPDENTPLFISFKQDEFQQIQQHIQKHMKIQQ